jgi:hypothetical protein
MKGATETEKRPEKSRELSDSYESSRIFMKSRAKLVASEHGCQVGPGLAQSLRRGRVAASGAAAAGQQATKRHKRAARGKGLSEAIGNRYAAARVLSRAR